uniref:Phospholipid scramblase n=1 Tax=Anas platyrhynchos TaxID=8839 RepID=A0A8B9TJ46_ANAPL
RGFLILNIFISVEVAWWLFLLFFTHTHLTKLLIPYYFSVFLGFESNNKYEIKNTLGQRIYFAVEDTDCCTRNFCGPSRPFTIRRPLRCSSCCFPCCLQEIEIQAPPGTPVGYVVQNWHPCLPKFTIQDERRMDVLKISGPCVVCSCCEDVNFEVCNAKIVCVYLLSDSLTITADNFGVAFPMDLDVKIKAVMIGACFLIVTNPGGSATKKHFR